MSKSRAKRIVEDFTIDKASLYEKYLRWYVFNQWEAALAVYYSLQSTDYDLKYVLIISTHWATSGYWIEEYNPSRHLPVPRGDYIYRGYSQVKALESRIRDAVAERQKSLEIATNYTGRLVL